jgi:hypothetical protein
LTDNINPSHYKLANGHQVIEVSENLSSNGGQAVQYIARATRSDGVIKSDPVEDLEKARWFIEREIQRLKAKPEEAPTLWELLGQVWDEWGARSTDWKVIVSPRYWDRLDEIPAGFVVEDVDGDRYRRVSGTARFEYTYVDAVHGQYYEWMGLSPEFHRYDHKYGPFTEVFHD